jgi:predicted hotdog family 3-hydroxylacyl-ACP dehydratase
VNSHTSDILLLPPLAELVPHSGSMLLLDELLHADEERTVARTTIRPDQLFADDEGVPGWVGIEYMAQTMAAWSGARGFRSGQPPRIGFLVGTRRYECDVPVFPPGSVLTITANAEMISEESLSLFACTISVGGREVARADITVFQPADAQAFLQGQHP